MKQGRAKWQTLAKRDGSNCTCYAVSSRKSVAVDLVKKGGRCLLDIRKVNDREKVDTDRCDLCQDFRL